jgi:hypothetical protein
MACLLVLLHASLHMFCVYCLCLFSISLAYLQYFVFSSAFNVIVIKCMVSSVTYVSYHHHHISNVLIGLPFCKLENQRLTGRRGNILSTMYHSNTTNLLLFYQY